MNKYMVAVLLLCESVGAGTTSTKGQQGQGQGQKDSKVLMPTFRPTPQNVTVWPGDRVVLRCQIDNLGSRTVGSYH